jgi:hypothetical protein
MTGEMESNTVDFEGIAGPGPGYSWTADVSREPSPQGLDGGRIQYLSVCRLPDPQVGRAPDFNDVPAYESWLSRQPRSVQVARFENGRLEINKDDPHVAGIVARVKDDFTDANKDLWIGRFPQEQPTRTISRASRPRSREADRERER